MREAGFHPERIPGAEDAVADASKFLAYLLDPDRDKAPVFASLGYDLENWEELAAAMLERLPYLPGRYSRTTWPGCDLYEVVMTIDGPGGRGELLTIWEHRLAKAVTRLVSAYPA